jgi:hypothetical protein
MSSAVAYMVSILGNLSQIMKYLILVYRETILCGVLAGRVTRYSRI